MNDYCGDSETCLVEKKGITDERPLLEKEKRGEKDDKRDDSEKLKGLFRFDVMKMFFRSVKSLEWSYLLNPGAFCAEPLSRTGVGKSEDCS